MNDLTDNIEVDYQVLDQYWLSIVGKSEVESLNHSKHLFIESFKKIASTEEPDARLFLDPRAFKINLPKTVFHFVATKAITCTVLQHFALELSVSILELLCDAIFETEKIIVEPIPEGIYLDLVIRDESKLSLSADAWYELLPEETKFRVNKLDFKDFLDHLVYAGYARAQKKDYLILKEHERLLKIHFRF